MTIEIYQVTNNMAHAEGYPIYRYITTIGKPLNSYPIYDPLYDQKPVDTLTKQQQPITSALHHSYVCLHVEHFSTCISVHQLSYLS